MFSINFPHQRSDQEIALSSKSQSCRGMKKHVQDSQAQFHKVFTTDKDQSPKHHEYSLGLSLLINQFKNGSAPLANDSETPKLENSISHQLKLELETILDKLHKKEGFILFDDELGNIVDNWTEKLAQELGIDTNIKEKNNLKGQIDFFFDSLIDQKNAERFVKEVQEFFKDNKDAAQKRKGFITKLADKYPLNKTQITQLVDILEPNRYSLANMAKVLKSMNKEYGFTKNKWQLTKTGAGFMGGALSIAVGGYVRSSALGILIGNGLMRTAVSCNFQGRMQEIDLLKDMKEKLNQRISETLVLNEFGNVDDEKFAAIHTTLTRGRKASTDLVTTVIGGMTPHVMTLGASMAFMGAVHPLLGASSLVSIPLMLKNAGQFLPKTEDLLRTQRDAQKKSTQEIKDIADTADDVLSSQNPGLIQESLEASLNEEDHYGIELQKLSHQIQKSFESTFWNNMFATAGLAYGLSETGAITQGEVFSSSFIAGGITSPLLNIIARSTDLLGHLQLVQDMEELIQSGETISLDDDAKKPGISSLDNFDIQFENVGFTGDDGETILEDLNYFIPQGSFTTITGRSGEGKSTLMKCLLNLYKPSTGVVKIGNQPRSELRQNGEDSVKSAIAYCGQAPCVLGSKTLKENLTLYSNEKISDEKIFEVLDQLGLGEFKNHINKKINKPSGGQRARIGIARALLKGNASTKILVLDEPTSGLDIETRAEVMKTLQVLHEKRKGNLTIIQVTHNEQVKNAVPQNFDLSKNQRPKA